MPKRFRCKDVGQKCGYVQTGDTPADLMPRIEEHMKAVHNLAPLPPDVRQRIEKAIFDLPPRRAGGAAPTAPSAPSPASSSPPVRPA